jgi:uncharacterized protein YjbJ (UPF0337 family)
VPIRLVAINLLYLVTYSFLRFFMSHRHDEDEAKGTGKQVKGKIKEAAGVLTDNKRWQAEGKMEKTEGKVQEKIGNLKRDLHDERHRHDDDL